MNTRNRGSVGEEKAFCYLLEKGYRIIDRNFNTRYGELDIVALKERIICFVEVKYRKNNSAGYAADAVTPSKMKKICKTAMYYILMHKQYEDFQMRFDVLAIDGEDISHFENAFDYIG